MSVSERPNASYERWRLHPQRVRTTRFNAVRPGRTGLSPAEVYAFVARVVAELSVRDAAEASLREENRRLLTTLRVLRAQRARRNPADWIASDGAS